MASGKKVFLISFFVLLIALFSIVLIPASLGDGFASSDRSTTTTPDQSLPEVKPENMASLTTLSQLEETELEKETSTSTTASIATTSEQKQTITTTGEKTSTSTMSAPQIPLVIFDTDMQDEIGDPYALAMLHSYASEKKIELAAVTISRNNFEAAKFTDIINTYYGRGNIPIGVASREAGPENIHTSVTNTFPYGLSSNLPEGHLLQREILADAEKNNREVIIIHTGHFTNLSNLLLTEPDTLSSKSGTALVESTVSSLSVSAGSISDPAIIEQNIKQDLPSAKTVFAKWPTKLLLSPNENGKKIVVPYEDITENFSAAHPLRKAYESKKLGWHVPNGDLYDMRSWDPAAVLIQFETDLFTSSPTGKITLSETGSTLFSGGAGKHQHFNSNQQPALIKIILDRSSFR